MEKLCIFCKHFTWTAEEMWGMGSTMTGPMFQGGDAECAKGHHDGDWLFPEDQDEYRKIILRGVDCPDFEALK